MSPNIESIRFIKVTNDSIEEFPRWISYEIRHRKLGPVVVDLEFGRDLDIFRPDGSQLHFSEDEDSTSIMEELCNAIYEQPEYKQTAGV